MDVKSGSQTGILDNRRETVVRQGQSERQRGSSPEGPRQTLRTFAAIGWLGERQRIEPGRPRRRALFNIALRRRKMPTGSSFPMLLWTAEMAEKLYFEEIKEHRGSHFVEYHPPVSDSRFATLNLVFHGGVLSANVADFMETELPHWLSR